MGKFVCFCHNREFLTEEKLRRHLKYSKYTEQEFKEKYFKEVVCKGCNKNFVIWKSSNQVFCSKECKQKRKEHNCLYCNKVFIQYVGRKRRFCSKSCSSKYRESHYSEEEKQHKYSTLLKKINASPNLFEVEVLSFINSWGWGTFKYVGDGSVLINSRSPDFINEELKIVVLANGCYWHLGKYSLKTNEENKRLREEIEAKPFLEAGYQVIFIWQDIKSRMEKDKLRIKVYVPELFGQSGMQRGYKTNLSDYYVWGLNYPILV